MAKANMNPKKNPMPTQDALVRARNFDEVALGYDEATAIDEALRCLSCKNMPCVSGCPVNIHIPEFIDRIKEGDFEGAYQVIAKSSKPISKSSSTVRVLPIITLGTTSTPIALRFSTSFLTIALGRRNSGIPYTSTPPAVCRAS